MIFAQRYVKCVGSIEFCRSTVSYYDFWALIRILCPLMENNFEVTTRPLNEILHPRHEKFYVGT